MEMLALVFFRSSITLYSKAWVLDFLGVFLVGEVMGLFLVGAGVEVLGLLLLSKAKFLGF
jgi:hypothetical protein